MADVVLPEGFDWKNPDYVKVFNERLERLTWLRQDPARFAAIKTYYRSNVAQMIVDWGCTSDPRNVGDGLPALVPFILFPRQVEWVQWVIESWKNQRPGVTPKSRESGISWLAMATAACLATLEDGLVIGFGSRKAEYVDKIGDPKSLLWKGRKFIETLPIELRGGYLPKDSALMRIPIRGTGSVLTGESGDGIGRGDRASIYFVDEAAYLEHPVLAEASLSQTTRCRIDVSTANGLGGPFYRKVTEWPADRVFRVHWRDDPRKGEEWYAKQQSELDPVTLAQEVDIDFAASVEGVLIPSAYVQAAIDAHQKLFISPNGIKAGALDVADEGADKLAFCVGQGILVTRVDEWSGVGDDIFGSVQRSFGICDEEDLEEFRYDGDGLGAGVRGDARVINDQRKAKGERVISVQMFRGSGAVTHPERQDIKGRKNQDLFANLKAQSWWSLRTRFLNTYRAVQEGIAFDPDSLISLSSAMPNLNEICAELSQPTYSVNTVGKIVVDKKPDGTKSPNKADSIMIKFAPLQQVMRIDDGVLTRVRVGNGAFPTPAGHRPRISSALLQKARGR